MKQTKPAQAMELRSLSPVFDGLAGGFAERPHWPGAAYPRGTRGRAHASVPPVGALPLLWMARTPRELRALHRRDSAAHEHPPAAVCLGCGRLVLRRATSWLRAGARVVEHSGWGASLFSEAKASRLLKKTY